MAEISDDARALCERLGLLAADRGYRWEGGEFEELLMAEVQAALDKAWAEGRAEERKRCAKIARGYQATGLSFPGIGVAGAIAAAIEAEP